MKLRSGSLPNGCWFFGKCKQRPWKLKPHGWRSHCQYFRRLKSELIRILRQIFACKISFVYYELVRTISCIQNFQNLWKYHFFVIHFRDPWLLIRETFGTWNLVPNGGLSWLELIFNFGHVLWDFSRKMDGHFCDRLQERSLEDKKDIMFVENAEDQVCSNQWIHFHLIRDDWRISAIGASVKNAEEQVYSNQCVIRDD